MTLFLYKQNSVQKTFTIAFLGDTMLGRTVNDTIKQTSLEYPWGNVLNSLQSKDLIIANLETTLTISSTPVPKVFNFKAAPDIAQSLKMANIGIVNLANNHSLDFGIEGLQETLTTLDKAGIKYVGAGMDRVEAQKAVRIHADGMNISIIGLTDNEPTWRAQDNKAGTHYIDIDAPTTEFTESIKKLKTSSDIVIVTMHWGPNMREYPSQKFIEFAHKLIDAGVDIIHGHSAHVVQGIEIYKNKIIMYDTGDFVDDYVVDPILRNDLSFIFTVEVANKKLHKLVLTPTKISNKQVNQTSGEDAFIAIELLKKRSEPFGTTFASVNNDLIITIPE